MVSNGLADGKTWYPVYATENAGKCIVVLGNLPGEVSPSEAEFLVVTNTGAFSLVEKSFPAPAVLRVGIGPLWLYPVEGNVSRNESLYYTELMGASALDA
jgi:hypothetical protein